MAWRDQLKSGASFRGVPFKTVDAEAQIGRRTVTHEFPMRDIPFVEDLGRRARCFRVDAYVLGEDYLDQRDALIKAIEEEGAGELVHPRWGRFLANVAEVVSVRESQREGGIAHFSITFVEAGQNLFPAVTQNTAVQVADATSDLDDAAGDDFALMFDVQGASVLAEEALKAVQKDLDGILSTVRRVTDVSAVGDLVATIGGISTDLADLIRTPVQLYQRLRGMYENLSLAFARPFSAISDFRSQFGANSRPSAIAVVAAVPGSTRARLLQNESARADMQRRAALSVHARALVLALQADTTAEPQVTTAAKAVQLRDALLQLVDTELEVNDPPPAVASALQRLRAAVVRDVATRSELLRQASSFTPMAVLPSLLLAHRIYQDATRADELEERNGVRNPLFVPARALEVLR